MRTYFWGFQVASLGRTSYSSLGGGSVQPAPTLEVLTLVRRWNLSQAGGAEVGGQVVVVAGGPGLPSPSAAGAVDEGPGTAGAPAGA